MRGMRDLGWNRRPRRLMAPPNRSDMQCGPITYDIARIARHYTLARLRYDVHSQSDGRNMWQHAGIGVQIVFQPEPPKLVTKGMAGRPGRYHLRWQKWVRGQGLLKMNVELLIDFIKENSMLNDYRNPSYKDNWEKEKKWKEIATKLGETSKYNLFIS
jgi:hypothetical protein